MLPVLLALWTLNLPGVQPVFSDPLVQALVVVHVVNVVLHHGLHLNIIHNQDSYLPQDQDLTCLIDMTSALGQSSEFFILTGNLGIISVK